MSAGMLQPLLHATLRKDEDQLEIAHEKAIAVKMCPTRKERIRIVQAEEDKFI